MVFNSGAVVPFLCSTTPYLDLREAVVIVPEGNLPWAQDTASQVLTEEVHKRTGLAWSVTSTWPLQGPVIALASRQAFFPGLDFPEPSVPKQDEGYGLWIDNEAEARPILWIVGQDSRGALFGAGRFLLEMRWEWGHCAMGSAIRIKTFPAYPIRGHQLGYRDTANTYDAWDIPQYERYIRELALFGSNAVEGIPFQDSDGPLMPVTRDKMNLAVSEICQRYEMDYWIWTPASFDLKDQEKREQEIQQHADYYEACPRLNAVFFPGGDPGNNPPSLVMPFLQDLSVPLAQHHPKARIWLSLQGWKDAWVDDFYLWLEKHMPVWFGGIVHGPSSPALSETRHRLPRRYGVRRYPDLTHTVRSQYPTPWWDPAFGHTLGREPVNPEPVRYAAVHNVLAPYADGFVSYSDGAHDDINKVVFSCLGWDPTRDVRDILASYAGLLFHPKVAEEAADGILALEGNWRGALAENGGVQATLSLWRSLEEQAPELSKNWRWQMCLLRAYYDAYVRERLLFESELEKKANQVLIQAKTLGSNEAMTWARRLLCLADIPDQGERWLGSETLRSRIFELCEELFQSIGFQTSVETYQAKGAERGAVLDFVDSPLNNRWWLEDEMDKVSELEDENDRVHRLIEMGCWETPGAGSFYDDIGNVAKSPRVLRGEHFTTDPVQTRNPNPDLMWWDNGRCRLRQSWVSKMDWPLGLRYEGLDPDAGYVVRTTGYRDCLLRANGIRLQPILDHKEIGEFKEFLVPHTLYREGILLLTFDVPHEPDLNWRVQSRLTEVWLLKQSKE